jgi:hypothetical protein
MNFRKWIAVCAVSVIGLTSVIVGSSSVSAAETVDISNYVEIPGLNAANTGDNTDLSGISCVSEGNCTVVGSYRAGSGNNFSMNGFIATQTNGVWGSFSDVPGLSSDADIVGGDVYDIDCSSPGNCTAVGQYFYRFDVMNNER